MVVGNTTRSAFDVIGKMDSGAGAA